MIGMPNCHGRHAPDQNKLTILMWSFEALFSRLLGSQLQAIAFSRDFSTQHADTAVECENAEVRLLHPRAAYQRPAIE